MTITSFNMVLKDSNLLLGPDGNEPRVLRVLFGSDRSKKKTPDHQGFIYLNKLTNRAFSNG